MHPADANFLYIVHSRFDSDDAATEAEWNAWYDEQHVPNLLSVPGIRTADRYTNRRDPSAYVAIYGIDSPEVFDAPRYREISGGTFGRWTDNIRDWRRGIYLPQTSLPTKD